MEQDSFIYLDHAATTPVRPEVIEAMMPFWVDYYGNPSSVHYMGSRAERGLTEAREKFAELTNSKPSEVIFTASGSESDNLAVRGIMWAARENGQGNHLITSAIEHKAVVETSKQLRDHHGFDLTIHNSALEFIRKNNSRTTAFDKANAFDFSCHLIDCRIVSSPRKRQDPGCE